MSNTTNREPLTASQERMVAELWKCYGNVSQSCKAVGVSRQTHYDWLDNSDTYKEHYRDIEESLLDKSESKMHELIEAGNPIVVMFHLKTRGKKRGYIEKIETDNKTETTGTVAVICPEKAPMPDDNGNRADS